MTTFNTRVAFDHIRNTAAGYTAANPVLGYGVIGLETDSGRAKIGDGTTAWNSLGYFTGQIDWAGITSKPSTFPPAAHTHDDRYYTESEVDTLLTGKQATGSYVLTTDARLSDARQPLTHTHTASQISDFTSAVIAAAPPTVDASLLTQGTLPDQRLSSNIARTSDITAAVANVVNAAPASLDTLKELADALGNDASFATTVTNSLASKAPIASPTFTGTVSGITKAMVGLGNVDNTSDASKPVSTAQAAADAAVASAAASDATTKANAAQAAAVQRANHTGTQTVATISDAGTAATRNVPATGNAGATEVVLGSDTRLTDARTPTGHSHGGINNLGQLSSTTVITATSVGGPVAFTVLGGNIGRGEWGTAAGTFCQGNDSRLSDARTPLAHTQAWTTITSTPTTLAGYGITDAVGSSDARLTDARTPTAHKSSHATGGSDALSPADIGAASVSHEHSAAAITSGTIDAARLGSGTADATTFLRGDGVWQTGPSQTFTFFRTTAPPDATPNAAIGTGGWDWTIPNGRIVVIEAVGGGGGGGSGRRWAAGNARFGGGGGGGGSRSIAQYVIADLVTRDVSVVVGGGGAGGAARTTDNTDGANGAGSTTAATSDVRYRGGSFTVSDKIVSAGGGSSGNGGSGTGAAGGGFWSGTFASSSGGGSFATANANTGGEAAAAGSGGGGGGGVSAGNVAFNGGAGGRISMYSPTLFGGAGGTAPGGAGSNAPVIAMGVAGQGGGGGAGNASGAGGNGGNGAFPGGGGGGGGASVNGFDSGAGGNGADGIVRITVWY